MPSPIVTRPKDKKPPIASSQAGKTPAFPQSAELRLHGIWAIGVFVITLILGGFVCNWFEAYAVPHTAIVVGSDFLRKVCAIMCGISLCTAVTIAADAMDRCRDEIDNMEDKF